MIKIAFFTGTRAEYGILKRLIKFLKQDPVFDISLLVGGIHLLKSFGSTYKEIESDGFVIDEKISFFSENKSPSFEEFSLAINRISEVLLKNKYDTLLIVGDRFEAYAAALAAHFTNTRIVHFGGGTITKGAVDNIYRYNISNLAQYHLATSKGNYDRLINLPIIDSSNVFFTGSVAIDSITRFKENPKSITSIIPSLMEKEYVLITMHPVTHSVEPVADLLIDVISFIETKGLKSLITYPNNDSGFEEIIDAINKLKNRPSVVVVENLGAEGYYSALNDCLFVLGNSSSGIIEAPYFGKQVINIGSRQDGREKDVNITDVSADKNSVITLLKNKFKEGWTEKKCNEIYGNGKSISNVYHIIKDKLSV